MVSCQSASVVSLPRSLLLLCGAFIDPPIRRTMVSRIGNIRAAKITTHRNTPCFELVCLLFKQHTAKHT